MKERSFLDAERYLQLFCSDSLLKCHTGAVYGVDRQNPKKHLTIKFELF